MRVIKNQTTQDTYVDALTLELVNARLAIIDIANAAVDVQFDLSEDAHGLWGEEQFFTPSVGTRGITGSGIRFKSAVPGKPAQVSCTLLDIDEATGLDALSPSVFTVGADGSVNRGGSVRVISHTEFTADVLVTGASEATANPVVVAPAIDADGTTAYLIEFFSPLIDPDVAALADVVCVLFCNAVAIGHICVNRNSAGGAAAKGYSAATGKRRHTPAAGSTVYEVAAYLSGAAGTGRINAGAGGPGQDAPGFIRVTSD